jgi:hypothetical protein
MSTARGHKHERRRGKKKNLWGGIIEYEEPVPDVRIEAVKVTIKAGLDEFEGHKKALLGILHNMHGRGTKSEPFDSDKAWCSLTRFAEIYFWRARTKQEIVPPAARASRLHELAKALGKARGLIDEAMQDEVGERLFSAWCEENVRYDIDLTGPLTLVRIDDEFDKAVAVLAALERAAFRAADEVPKGRGRPKGTAILPSDFIEGLAEVYQNSTGSKPGAGSGPFARFVHTFLTALGRGNIEYDSVVDAIKDARGRARMRLAAIKWGSSPFDDET